MPVGEYFKGHGEDVMRSIRKAHPDYSEERVREEFYRTANAQEMTPERRMVRKRMRRRAGRSD